MYNILVVEDDKVTNKLLTYSLKESGYNPIQAFDGKEAIALLDRFKFHLIITDIIMPNIDGYGLLDNLKNDHSPIPVIIMSALNSDFDILKGYDYPIEDYFLKPLNHKIFAKKIDAIINRLYPQNRGVEIDYQGHLIHIKGEQISLTNNEFEVFTYLFNNNLKTCQKEEIFEQVWGNNYEVSIRVVDYTIKRLRKKLAQHKDIIKTKSGIGYKYEE